MAAAGTQATVLGGEVGVLGAGGGERGLGQRDPEPARTLASATGAPLAGGLVVAGALTGPGGEALGGREGRHVGSGLGDDHLSGSALDPGIVQSSSTADSKGRICSSIASERRSICSSRKSRWARIAPTISACWASKRPSSASRRAGSSDADDPWRARPATRDRWCPKPARRASPAPRRRARAGHAVELHPGVLEDLVKAVRLALALLDLGLAIARQVAKRPHRLGRHEARAQEGPPPARLQQLRDPASVTSVFRPGTCLSDPPTKTQSTRSSYSTSTTDAHWRPAPLRRRPPLQLDARGPQRRAQARPRPSSSLLMHLWAYLGYTPGCRGHRRFGRSSCGVQESWSSRGSTGRHAGELWGSRVVDLEVARA